MKILRIVCFAAAFIAVSSDPAKLESDISGFYIQNVKTGLVMTQVSDPVERIVMEKPEGLLEQIWNYKYGMLFNMKSGQVITTVGGDSHVAVIHMENPKPEGIPDQKWKFQENGAIQSDDGFTLDVWDFRKEPGAEVIGYYQFHRGDNQVFRILPVSRV